MEFFVRDIVSVQEMNTKARNLVESSWYCFESVFVFYQNLFCEIECSSTLWGIFTKPAFIKVFIDFVNSR